MQDHIFRTYDIRGVVGSELLIENVYDFARAFVFYCTEKKRSVKYIAIGIDSRSHSMTLKQELLRGFKDSGIRVFFLGQCPTPVLYYSQYVLPVQAGVMITASHNPIEYNGFKMVLNQQPIADQQIKKLYECFVQKKRAQISCSGAEYMIQIIPEYINYLKRQFSHLVGSEITVVFDCVKGATATVIPQLIKCFEWPNAQAINIDIDGTFSCQEPDPSQLETMKTLQKVQQEQGALLAIGFDGDGDRMAALDEQGALIAGDKLLGVFAAQILETHPGAAIVYDSKCSDALREWIEMHHGKVSITKTGRSFIQEALQKEGAVCAGELSGHFIFADRYFGFDDGIYAALRLIERIQETGKSLRQLLMDFPQRFSSPELRIECQSGQGPLIVSAVLNYFQKKQQGVIDTLDGVKVTFSFGWGLLRSSNTQSVVCLRLEGQSEKDLIALRHIFIDALSEYFDRSWLEKVVIW